MGDRGPDPIHPGGVAPDITAQRRHEDVLTFLAQAGGGTESKPFFESLARYLARSLGMDFVCIDRLEGGALNARTVAVWCDGQIEDNLTYALNDTPCGAVVGKAVCCFPAHVCQSFPRDHLLQDLRAEGYVGVTLFGHAGQPIGLIAVISRQPLCNPREVEATLQIVGPRAAAELERLDAEEALRKKEAEYRALVQQLPVGIVVHDPETAVLLSNPAASRLLGLSGEAMLGRSAKNPAWRFLREDGTQMPQAEYPVNRVLSSAAPITNLVVGISPPDLGKPTWVLCNAYPAHDATGRLAQVIVTFADITKRQQIEAERAALEIQLQQAQKLETVGRLAGGVAHDFNNLLMGIMNYVELCQDTLPLGHVARPYLDEIAADARRSAAITQQLLAFARKQTIAPKTLDLNDALAGILKMLRRLLGEDIGLAWRPQPGLWPVKIDPSQIDQILANLCVNARDAIAAAGTVSIETANVSLGRAYCAEHADARPGDYVRLAVSDTGCGMDSDVLAHLFEPFFTTKQGGKGTGLGLATVHGIVSQNHGHIDVQSEPGTKTTFSIYLPRAAPDADTEPVAAAAGELPRGTETILLAEDERSVRVTAQLLLEALGYTVLAAGTPGEAMRLADAHSGPICLLITDVIMPSLNGPDLAGALADERPGLKCLFISGYTADVMVQRGTLSAGMPFLAKPFTRADLAHRVREVLDAPAPGLSLPG